MAFSPTVMQQKVSGGMSQSPYRGPQRQAASPATGASGYHPSFLASPASGRVHPHQQQPRYLRHGDGDARPEGVTGAGMAVTSPTVKASPKRPFPHSSFISCMFAASSSNHAASSPACPSPGPTSVSSSPASTSSSPCYSHQHQQHFQTHSSHAKRQLMWKENNPSAVVLHRNSVAQSGLAPPSLAHCKRRLDFNHNPITDSDLDPLSVHVNVHFAAVDDLALQSFCPTDVSPSLSSQGEAPLRAGAGAGGVGGRTPAVAVARRNERERNRVKLINMTFATLREHLPQSGAGCAAGTSVGGCGGGGGDGGDGGGGGGKGNGSKSKKMSKVETLRAAIEYIRQLHTMIKDKQQQSCADQDKNQGRDAFSQDQLPLGDPLATVLKVEPVDLESEYLATSAASLPLLSSSSLTLVSPGQSSGGGAGSPVSDDGCFGYDLLSAEDEDLLEFASNWF